MFDFIQKWKDKVVQYVDVEVRLVKLEVIEKASSVLSYFLFAIASLMVVLAVFVFGGFALAEFLSHKLGSGIEGAARVQGFSITAAIFLALLILLVVLRNSIVNGISGLFIRMLTEQKAEADEHHSE